jgi:(2Fe-2S) ferredoxin
MSISSGAAQTVRKVFICNNGKCASTETAHHVYQTLIEMIHARGMDEVDAPLRIKCLLSGCLDVCENGPIMVVHPGATYYQQVDLAALQKIFENHLMNGKIVSENVLQIKKKDVLSE